MTKNKIVRTVIVTGGSSGIGRALAFEYGRQGHHIVITGRNEDRLHQTDEALKKEGIKVLPIVADSAKEADNEKIARLALQRFGRIDILINNAGISMRALFEDLEDVSVIRQLMEINFFGTVYATHACLPQIIKNEGSIISVSSIAGYRGLPARTGYSASKAAMQGFMESLRTEMIPHGVHVMVVCPGFTESNIRNTALTASGQPQGKTPLQENKLMSAQEVAAFTYKAWQKKQRDLILTQQGKMTVWLNKLFPGWMDKKVLDFMAKEADSPLKKQR